MELLNIQTRKENKIMEFKKGDKTVNVPVLGFIAGVTTIGLVATEICKVAIAKKNK